MNNITLPDPLAHQANLKPSGGADDVKCSQKEGFISWIISRLVGQYIRSAAEGFATPWRWADYFRSQGKFKERRTAMNPKETAIVFIEFQNDFCKEGGALYEGVKNQIKVQNTIKNAQACIQKARGKCLTLIVPILFEQDYCDAGCAGVLGPIHVNAMQAKAFRKDTWGGAIVDELKPTKQDIVVEGKRTLDAFHSTNLDFILRTNCIKNVAFCGFLTNVCVEGTARSAYDKGFKVFLLKDCCAAISGEEQKYVEEKFFPYIGEVLTHEEFLKKLK